MAPSLVYGLVLLVAACWFGPSLAFHSRVSRSNASLLKSTSAPIDGSAAMIKSILKKPSKVLTVGLEYIGNNLSNTEINTLSMQLRKSKVSFIVCSQSEIVKELVSEQESARGNFPGPVPIIYNGPDTKSAVANGAQAIILPVNADITSDCETIWRIETKEDAGSIQDTAEACFLDTEESNVSDILTILPSDSLCIAALNPMQVDSEEIEQGKQFKKAGFASVFVKNACVGDAEDLPYAQYLVDGLTSKASSEYKFSVLVSD